jgi:hypothetical protein
MRQQGLTLLICYAKKGCFPGCAAQDFHGPSDYVEGTQRALSHALGDTFRRRVASQGIVILVDLSCYFGDLKMSGGTAELLRLLAIIVSSNFQRSLHTGGFFQNVNKELTCHRGPATLTTLF